MSVLGIPSISLSDASSAIIEPPVETSISANFSLSRRWENLKDDLKKIRRYRDNWDGFGADAPDPSLIDTAIDFLSLLRRDENVSAPPFRVALSPNGTVSIEWQSANGYTEAEVVSYDCVEWTEITPEHGTERRKQYLTNATESFRGSDWERSTEIASDAAVSALER